MAVSSIYIHIPFCKNICPYCNFSKIYYDSSIVNKYLDSLKKEINTRYNGEIIKTIYIGGGSPSCLSLEELTNLFNILKTIKLDNNYEFSIEVNVCDINDELLTLFKNYGINRLSIGVQTVNEKYIRFLGRKHTKEMVSKNINIAKKYFSNISIDLMYGFYEQTIEELNKDIDFIISLKPKHISTYSLIIEENTLFYINKIKQIDEEIESMMYYNIIDRINNSGYIHYEISNFSLKGYESKHNLVYWNNEEYYGFGLSASGYFDNIRYTNTYNINKYIAGKYLYEEEKLNIEDKIEYEMILGLRKIKGINLDKFKIKYNIDVVEIYNINKLIKEKKLILDNGYLSINKEYLYISNQIFMEFIK